MVSPPVSAAVPSLGSFVLVRVFTRARTIGRPSNPNKLRLPSPPEFASAAFGLMTSWRLIALSVEGEGENERIGVFGW
jgi:hypothetical protein